MKQLSRLRRAIRAGLIGVCVFLCLLVLFGGRSSVVRLGRFTIISALGQPEQESDALRNAFADALRDMKAQMATMKPQMAVQVGDARQLPDFEFAGQRFAFGQLTAYLRDVVFGPPVTVTGDLAFIDESARLSVRIENLAPPPRPWTTWTTREGMYEAVEQAARETFRAVSPFELAAYYVKRKREPDALDAIAYTIRHPPYEDDCWAYNLWGVLLLEHDDRESAVAKFRRAIDLDPDFAPPYSNWGGVLEDAGDLAGAIAKYRLAVRHSRSVPGSADAYCNLGNALRRQGRTDEAFAAFREALRLNPASADAFNRLGRTLFDLGRFQPALDAYDRAAELDSRDEFEINRGTALEGLNEYEAALRAYEKAIQVDPRSANGHWYFANLLAQRGRNDQAMEHYRMVSELERNTERGREAAKRAAELGRSAEK